MKVYGLIGKSGTGKSYQAVNLCKELNIESIIDDGLFICRNKVMAGISAKRQPTKVGAVKTALFNEEGHMEEVRDKIKKIKPSSILIIGTSDGMVDRIVSRLELPKINKRIYIDDITTEEERALAKKHREEMGQHVIPAPTFQLKRQFSGYFMLPMRALIKELGSPWRDMSEKSVVRPTYSYLGDYKISGKVMNDIVECVKRESAGVYEVVKVALSPVQDGVDVFITANFKFGVPLADASKDFQKNVAARIEEMTAFNVNKLDLEVKDIVW
ncbi:MAG: Asp23/Gls24 family envelope stress response protein [Firmicutes bacterium]|nr:Asp23/Gls24 family envelope stress response protein [Bacillota bacterium]